MSAPSDPPDAGELVRAQYRALATGDRDLLISCAARDFTNRESAAEPPACRGIGPAALAATSAWLHFALADISFEELEQVTGGRTIVSRVIMRGRQTGPLVFFDGDRPTKVFPPTSRRMETEQVHIFRVRGSEIVEHLARRDDAGMMLQLGHLPPTPASILRMLRWKVSGRSSRAGQAVAAAASGAAAEVQALLAEATQQ